MLDYFMSITNTNHIQCYKHFNSTTNQLKLYFVIPYYLFNVNTVKIITNYLLNQLTSTVHEILPITAPEKCRIHCRFQLNGADPLPDEESIERFLHSRCNLGKNN